MEDVFEATKETEKAAIVASKYVRFAARGAVERGRHYGLNS